jgi:predicted transposase YdaD
MAKPTQPTTDQDSPWKRILQLYFPEEERRMPYITSVERIGYERGQQEGRQALIMKQLERRLQFAALPDAMQTRIQALAIAQLEDLGEALLDFTTLADLEVWLAALPAE